MDYFDFSIHHNGRLRRSVFWRTFVLITVLQIVIDLIASESITDYDSYIALSIIVYAVSLPFELSLIARRFQDAGYSSELKYTFLMLNVMLGLACIFVDFDAEGMEWLYALWFGYLVALIICGSKDSQPGSNLWGDNPKGIWEKAPLSGAGIGGAPVGAGGASQVCPCCSGNGINAAGYVCPHCGGTGVMKNNMR